MTKQKRVLSTLWLFVSVFCGAAASADKRDLQDHLEQCEKFDEKGEDKKTIECYESAIAKNKGYAAAAIHNKQGDIYRRLGLLEKAHEQYSLAIAADNSFSLAYLNRGNVWHDRSEFAKALADFEEAYRRDFEDTRALFRIAECYQDMDKSEEAVRWWTTYLERRPDDPEGYSNRGLVFFGMKDYGRAKTDLDKALARRPKLWPALVNRALVLRALGKLKEAVADLDKAAAIAPQYSIVFEQRARTKAMMGDREGALRDIDRALRLLPDNMAATKFKADLLLQAGNKASADALKRKVEESAKGSDQRAAEKKRSTVNSRELPR